MEPASRQQALDAVRAFHAEHGRLPRWHEWERVTASRPCAKTIERRWGWRDLLAEAIATQPNQIDLSWETLLDVRVQAMLAALAAARDELGRWLTGAEWDRSGRPSARTFVRHLGGWAEACRAASRRVKGPVTQATRSPVSDVDEWKDPNDQDNLGLSVGPFARAFRERRNEHG